MGSPDGPAGALTRSPRGALPPRPVRELPPRPDPMSAVATSAARLAGPAVNATLVAREDLTSSISIFRFRPDVAPTHIEPGQYLSVGLVVGDLLIQRPYSTSTAPGGEDELEFLIRLVPDGTFTPRLWTTAIGDRVRLGPPRGRFTRTPGDPRTHLSIATGTGIAPFIAMLVSIRREWLGPDAVLVHGVSRADEFAYRGRLAAWATEGTTAYEPTISRPDHPANAGWRGRTGRVEHVLDDIWWTQGLDPDDTVAFLCGNPAMIEAVEPALRALGMPAEAIRSEHYWPAS